MNDLNGLDYALYTYSIFDGQPVVPKQSSVIKSEEIQNKKLSLHILCSERQRMPKYLLLLVKQRESLINLKREAKNYYSINFAQIEFNWFEYRKNVDEFIFIFASLLFESEFLS